MASPDSNAREQAIINKSVRVNELRRTIKTSNEKIDDGKSLLEFYLSEGYMEMEAGLKVPRTVPVVSGERAPMYLHQGSLAKNKAWAISAAYYMDVMFPKGGKYGKFDIEFYSVAGTVANIVQFKGYNRKTKVSKQATYWENLLRGKDRRNRVLKIRSTIATLKDIVKSAKKQLDALGEAYVSPVETNINDNNTGTGDNGTPPDNTVNNNYDNKPLDVNVGMVNEAYFSPTSGWQDLVNARGDNKPHAVTNAMTLWNDSKSNKGMIWLYSQGQDSFSWEPSGKKPNKSTKKRYAFQFHYNPSTIDMAWAGTPEVDVSMETSGKELYDLINGQTMSAITFSVVLNRMFDMQYYGSDGLLKPGRRGNKNPYSPMQPDAATQKRIYNYGTMYDVEYLLSTILGFKLDTRFRGSSSDVGFLTGRPVDVYLGNRLRYWGYIADISLTHQIFDERMVPTFTILNITLSRIPDYAG